MRSDQHDELREYLLGGLSAPERDAIAGQYFESDSFFEQVEAAEDELIESYLRNELTARDHARFESRFLTVPEQRNRVEQARVLREALVGVTAGSAEAPGPPRRRFPASLGRAMAAAAGLGLLWLAGSWILQNSNLESQVEQLRAQLAAERSRTESIESAAPASIDGFLETVATLTSRSTRSLSVSSNEVTIPPRTNLLRLRLTVRPEFKHGSYRVSLKNADFDLDAPPLWVQTGLPATAVNGALIVEVQLPSSLLPQSDYILSLDGAVAAGFEPVDSYWFRVSR